MRKIDWPQDVLPHVGAVGVFLIVTVLFFSPVVFQNKVISQYDITQFLGASKSLRDFREATGEEGLWATHLFSGMPAYLVNVQWSDGPVVALKKILTLFLPHPVNHLFLSFVSFYLLLLSFRVRPWLAVAGALSFGLSTYVVIGFVAGHNARIGAVALMPLVLAGIHWVFSGKRWWGTSVAAVGLALHLRENHLQITYYLLLMVLAYGAVQLFLSWRSSALRQWLANVGVLTAVALLAVGTFFGQLWAISEYTRFSIRGPSELQGATRASSGLSKEYAFRYSNEVMEPLALLFPNIRGGSASEFFVNDPQSKTYRALVQSNNSNVANRLAQFSSHYWGEDGAPYYAGAVICLLFVVGLAFAEKKWIVWLVPLVVLSVLLSMGKNFSSLNYFLFDFFPGYNKFRSVTFAIIIALVAIPLLGMLGLERLLQQPLSPSRQRRFLVAVGLLAGFILLLMATGVGSYVRSIEEVLPDWFVTALARDRASLFRQDAWRAFIFVALSAALVWLMARQYIKATAGAWLLVAFILVDQIPVGKRFLTSANYQRKREARIETTPAHQEILRDQGHYRVYNLQGAMNEAFTSYFHRSIGGYHGAKMRRYQEFYDSVLAPETDEMISSLQQGVVDFSPYAGLNLLNVRYLKYGDEATDVLANPDACGPAWFVKTIRSASTPTEELAEVRTIDSRTEAVVNTSRYTVPAFSYDSTATLELISFSPNRITYRSNSSADGFAVFSEIFYPKGWVASIDGTPAGIIQTNYVVRGLWVPSGAHEIEFKFQPAPYTVGNPVTQGSSWLLILWLVGSAVRGWRASAHNN